MALPPLVPRACLFLARWKRSAASSPCPFPCAVALGGQTAPSSRCMYGLNGWRPPHTAEASPRSSTGKTFLKVWFSRTSGLHGPVLPPGAGPMQSCSALGQASPVGGLVAKAPQSCAHQGAGHRHCLSWCRVQVTQNKRPGDAQLLLPRPSPALPAGLRAERTGCPEPASVWYITHICGHTSSAGTNRDNSTHFC